MPKKKTYTLFILSLLLLLASAAIFGLAFHIVKLKNTKASLLLNSLNQNIAQEDNIENLQKDLAETNEKREQIASYIVDKNQIDVFIEWLENLGDKLGIKINVTNVSQNTAKKNILNLSLNTSGSFSSVMKFVSLIENAPYQTRIKNLNISKVSGGGDTSTTNDWNVVFDVEVVNSN